MTHLGVDFSTVILCVASGTLTAMKPFGCNAFF